MCPCDVAAKREGHMGHIGHMGRSPMGQRDSHAVLYMLCRCGGFSWAKPSVTKSSTHLLVSLVLKSTCSPSHAVLRVAPFLSILWFLKSHAVLRRRPCIRHKGGDGVGLVRHASRRRRHHAACGATLRSCRGATARIAATIGFNLDTVATTRRAASDRGGGTSAGFFV